MRMGGSIRRGKKDDDAAATQKPGSYLYAFDFDHTVVEANSDVEVRKVLSNPLPPELKYDDEEWDVYMDKVMKFISTQGITLQQIENQLTQMKLAPGMDKLLHRITNSSKSQLIIISDANTFFISTILSHLKPPIIPNEIFSNRGTVTDGNYIKVGPYENQSECKLCPTRLCKGSALEKYIKEKGPFDEVYYAGDGQNDLCPGSRLRATDTLFVRKGFGLEKLIKDGRRLIVNDVLVVIKAKIVYYKNGSEIEKQTKV